MTGRVACAWLSSVVAAAAAPPSTCAPCHREAREFASSAMAQALSPASESAVLKSNAKLAARLGPYSYEIDRSDGVATLTVTDDKETLRVPLLWAFGEGKVGQTYLYRLNGRWHESRVSYFQTLPGLDITIGQHEITPRSLAEAAGRLAGPAEVTKCFDCHATGVGKQQPPELSGIAPGVQCERCHGASDLHLKSVRIGSSGWAMKKLGAMGSEEMSDFCGQCHRTWSQVAANGPRGIQNIRFQPYRLSGSKCYSVADSRIKCTACHDPHQALETRAESYDAKCVACHSATDARAAGARTCRTGSQQCVSCHMPKIDLPGAHRKFTDHRIRVVRWGEAYPD